MTSVPIPPISTPIFDYETRTFTQPWYSYLSQTSATSSTVRTRLSADTTYYVRTDGNDGNTGLSNTSGGAFKTIQGALDYIGNNIDVVGYLVTVQVASGTYAEIVTLPTLTGCIGTNPPVLKGDTATPANVIIDGTGLTSATVTRFEGHSWRLQGFTIKSDNACINAHARGWIRPANIVFSTCGYCGYANYNGIIEFEGNFTISASPSLGIAFLSIFQGFIFTAGAFTFTMSGSPNWSTAFAYCYDMSLQAWITAVFSGASTGVRYISAANSVIDTAGGGANFLPGNSAGSTATGGQYL